MAEPQMSGLMIVARMDEHGLRVQLQGRAVYGDGEQQRAASHTLDITEGLEALRQALRDLVAANLWQVTDATIAGAMEARDVAIRRGEMGAAGADAQGQAAAILDLMGGMGSVGDTATRKDGA